MPRKMRRTAAQRRPASVISARSGGRLEQRRSGWCCSWCWAKRLHRRSRSSYDAHHASGTRRRLGPAAGRGATAGQHAAASAAAAAGRCAAPRDLLHAHRRRAARGPSIRAIDAAASRPAPKAASRVECGAASACVCARAAKQSVPRRCQRQRPSRTSCAAASCICWALLSARRPATSIADPSSESAPGSGCGRTIKSEPALQLAAACARRRPAALRLKK
jgi:hypothetical protein